LGLRVLSSVWKAEVALTTIDIPTTTGGQMRIQVKGRNGATVDEELLSRLEKKLAKVGRQVSPLAVVEVQLSEERNSSTRDAQVAEATLQLKGTTLRARESATDMGHAINLMVDDLARQVKKHRDKRRGRREARQAGQQPHPV
jgi:putative sigma-54 modulation protein